MRNIFTIMLVIFLSNKLMQSQGLQPFGLHDKVITSLAAEQTDYNSLIPPSDYIFAGTDTGVYKALAVDETPEWVLVGPDTISITALTLHRWGAGPADGLKLVAAVLPDFENGDSTLILSREVKLSTDTIWTPADSGLNKNVMITALNSYYYQGHTPPGPLLAGTASGIYTGNGSFWTKSETNVENPYLLATDVAPHWGGDIAWAVGHYGTAPNINPLVLHSTDRGVTWEQFILPIEGISATSVAINSRNPDSVYVSCNNYIFLTTHNGETWQDVFSSRGISISAVALDPYRPENVFAGGLFFDDSHQSPNHGVFLHSTNGGKDWDEYTAADTLLHGITSIVVFRKPDDNNTYVFITTAGTGVWLYKYSTITGIETDKNIPEQFSLIQNYPNPFNPSTAIKYELPEESEVQLAIYNLLGEKVAELVNTFQKAGSYEVKWNAGNYSSSVYLYKIKAGDFISTKKLLLLK